MAIGKEKFKLMLNWKLILPSLIFFFVLILTINFQFYVKVSEKISAGQFEIRKMQEKIECSF
jgi:hypothetical protein